MPYFLVGLNGPIVQCTRGLFAQPGEEGSHLPFVKSHLLTERSQVNGLHSAE
jgi:hypothetical protein